MTELRAEQPNGRHGMRLRGVKQAAQALGLSVSSVSEQLRTFIDRGWLAVDAHGRFDMNAYLALRASGAMNPLMARRRGGGLGYEPTLAEVDGAAVERPVAPVAGAGMPRPSATDSGSEPRPTTPMFQQVRTAREGYQAKLAQLDYEQRVGALVAADELRDAAFEISRQFREHMAARVETFAARLKVIAPAATLEALADAIVEDDRRLQQKLADAFVALASGVETENGDEDG